MRTILELLRIIFIFTILGAISSSILLNIYRISPVAEAYAWIGFIAIFLLMFAAYRNRWQFSGWYKGKEREKLPKFVSTILTVSSIILIFTPFILDFFLA